MTDAYFQAARSWHDDIYTATLVRCQRYKIAFYSMTGLCALLVLALLMLIPLQHTELVIVHEGESGYTWVSTTHQDEKFPIKWARVQSDIAHYVIARESYDPWLYAYQTRDVMLFSASAVQTEYVATQAQATAPVHKLGNKGYRTVTVNSVLRLDPQHSLVQVNFVTEDHDLNNHVVTTPYTALVSWRYDGVPSNPEKMLKNWSGFLITKYVVQQVSL